MQVNQPAYGDPRSFFVERSARTSLRVPKSVPRRGDESGQNAAEDSPVRERDRNLRLVASNKAFRTLRGYPAALCKPGTELVDLYRFNARRGDYGSGDVEMNALSRLDRVRRRAPHDATLRARRFEDRTPDGRISAADKHQHRFQHGGQLRQRRADLLAHETYSLVKDAVIAEETGTITVKGFSTPVKTYRVVGLLDDAEFSGRVIRQEQDGLLLIIDTARLGGKGRADAIRLLEEAMGRLKD